MVFDDVVYIERNVLVTETESFTFPLHPVAFHDQATARGVEADLSTNLMMRPLAYLTFHLNWLAAGGFKPDGFRAVNIFLHLGCAAMLQLFLFRLSRMLGKPIDFARRVGWAAALLFAVHPLATETAAYIAQRFTSLSTFFYLLCLWCHLGYLRSTSGAWRLAAVASLLLGMLSKECPFTAPVMAVLMHSLLFGVPIKRAIVAAWPLVGCMVIVPAEVLFMAWYQSHGEWSLAAILNVDGYKDTQTPSWQYAISQPQVWWSYLAKLAAPVGLCAEPAVPVRDSPLAWQFLLSLGAMLTVFVLLIRWHVRQRGGASLAFFGAVWFLFTLLPSSSIFVLPDLAAEHRSYLPSVGIFTALAWAWATLAPRKPQLSKALLGVVLILSSVITWQRLTVWSDPILFWTDVTAKNPGSHRAWSNLGTYYAMSGDIDTGIKHLRTALEVEPRHGNSATNLAKLLLDKNLPREALEVCAKHIKAHPSARNSTAVVNRVAQCYAMLAQHDDAIPIWRMVIQHLPDHSESHAGLALCYAAKRDYALAVHHAKQVVRLDPQNSYWRTALREIETAAATASQ
jgi:Flp pilus assembly protein TadD